MQIVEQLKGANVKSIMGLVLVTIVVVAAAPKLLGMVMGFLGVIGHALGTSGGIPQ